MQRVLLRYGIQSLMLCLSICPVAWANTNQTSLPAKEIVPFSLHENRDSLQDSGEGDSPIFAARKSGQSPRIETPLSDLEQRLFADAADGRLDDFSLLDASLIASGVDDADVLKHYRERIATWAEELRQNNRMDGPQRRQVEAIFEFIHRKILYGKYNIECTDLRHTLDEGRFNCVSATVLFNCLASELGLSCCALETPGHALSRVFLPDGPLDVETTCPRWFQLQHEPVKQAEMLEKTIGRKTTNDKAKLREISHIQLTAMIYYNRGIDFLAEKRFADATAANAKAIRLDPLNVAAQGNFLATINNWAIELGNTGHFAQAVALLRQGLVIDPHYEAFALNFVHVHHQCSQQLCKEGRYQEAVVLLNRAALEMPGREYLQHAVWEVYRRWSLTLFEADRIDEAFAVFAEARRCHGACQEELNCELAAVISYGRKLIAQNRYEEARQIFDRALVLQPEAPILRDNRHAVLENSKQ
jgi:tetratricopeptide (TPR) repeat protein